MYAVGSNAEALRLLTAACPTNIAGSFIAPELAEEQTLDNLDAFSARLDRVHALLEARGLCDCRR